MNKVDAKIILVIILVFISSGICSQKILPMPFEIKELKGTFQFRETTIISWDVLGEKTAVYLKGKFPNERILAKKGQPLADILFKRIDDEDLGDEGYNLKILSGQIIISANTETGCFYGVQSLLHLLPPDVAYGSQELQNASLACMEIIDKPKYSWRSFMLDSGRQYQTPEFIKQYLDRMAMLKLNVFHWHLTEGQGWRIEIKKYPKLTSIGSKVAKGEEQQGFYTQDEIRDIVKYAERLHITVVPEIDVPGHSEAAMIAYPELTCFGKAPETVMAFSPNLFCGGKEETYTFLQNVLQEVCDLFPSEYIHLGGDEAPKDIWDKCPDCQAKIKNENLINSHDLQLYFSKRLARFLGTKKRKVIFWGDVVYQEGVELPDNVVVYWWNWRGHKDKALVNAIAKGHQVICGTNYYTYLNFPVTPWNNYREHRTFDIKTVYEENPSDLEIPHNLVLGMGTCLWTDWYVKQNMIDRRVFPRIFALAEQMWSSGQRLPFDTFYDLVKSKYQLLEKMGIDYGPAMGYEVPDGYKWD
ncbi:beta-N-acetylhexosaminidase [Labilibacter sediminis]|nr:beta-N-acetylhexosaminidase [Labilibacter sediminis]